MGTKAFNFSFYRFGPADPELLRQYDMDLTLSLSVIQYVHSQRFLSEIIAFGQHFIFLQEVLGRMRAAGAGDEVMLNVNLKYILEGGSPCRSFLFCYDICL